MSGQNDPVIVERLKSRNLPDTPHNRMAELFRKALEETGGGHLVDTVVYEKFEDGKV